MQPQSFTLIQGEALEELVASSDDFDEPVDITSATLSFAVAREPGDDVVASTDVSPPSATADASVDGGGEILLAIAGDVTALMLGTYAWECRADEAVVARGYLTVNKRVGG